MNYKDYTFVDFKSTATGPAFIKYIEWMCINIGQEGDAWKMCVMPEIRGFFFQHEADALVFKLKFGL